VVAAAGGDAGDAGLRCNRCLHVGIAGDVHSGVGTYLRGTAQAVPLLKVGRLK